MLQDRRKRNLEIVDSVSKYIDDIQKLEKNWCDGDNDFIVFRGEAEEYDVPCIPTIYRDLALKQVNNYEINMFLAMRQNDISNSADYLHNAIDAQHDGFPSRLLDVSYNCLIALYFATTPYYNNKEDLLDDKDGFVYAFKFDEAYSPEANNTKDIYLSALKGKDNLLNASFFATNHKLIDHCRQNKRIIAQQGAFILFAGETPEPIPYYQMFGIRISGNAKARIRHELRSLFGIYTGSVYPEVELMHDEIKAKCMRMNTAENSIKNNIEATLESWQKEYDYFLDCCDYFIECDKGGKKKSDKDWGEFYRLVEKNIASHEIKLNNLLRRVNAYNKCLKEHDEQIVISDIQKKYQDMLDDFIDELPEQTTLDTILTRTERG